MPSLKRALERADRDSPYVQLVDLGVLVESWEGSVCRVSFGFDRLFEDQLARLHEPRIADAADVASLAARAIGYASLRGALALLLGRSAHHGRAAIGVQALRFARASNPEGAAILSRAVVDTLTALARSHDPALAEILAAIGEGATDADARLLVQTIDRLALVSEALGTERVLEAASALTETLDAPATRAELALRSAIFQQQRGEWAVALGHLDLAKENAAHAGDEALSMRATLVAGEDLPARWASQKRRARCSDVASRWFLGHGELARAAEAKRQQAIVEGTRGDLEARRKLVVEAVPISRAHRKTTKPASAPTRRSRQTHRLLGEGEGAVRWLGEALAAAEAAGHARLIANALNNLGVALRENRERARAGTLFTRAASLFERMGDKTWLPGALHNLALTRMDEGNVAEAIDLSRRSISLYEAVGEQNDIIEAKALLGSLLAADGDTDDARKVFDDALAIARRTGHSAGTQSALFHLGCLDARAGRLDVAHRAADELEGLAQKEPSPLAELTSASLSLVVAATDPRSNGLAEKTARLRAARERVTSMQDVHAGPAVAWHLASRRAAGDDDRNLREDCARELARELDGRWFPGSSEPPAL